MHLRNHRLTLFPAALLVVLVLLTARQSAQGPAMSIAPVDATIVVGQTLPLTASGAAAPTVVSAGGEYTCLRLPDGTVRCAGRNQFGQLGDGSWTNSTVLVRASGLTSAKVVVAGDEFSCALLVDGTAQLLGAGREGTARRRHLRPDRARSSRGPGPGERDGARRRLQPRVRAAEQRDDAVLGLEHGRPARRSLLERIGRAHRRPQHQRGDRDDGGRLPHLRLVAGPHGALLGRQRRRCSSATARIRPRSRRWR